MSTEAQRTYAREYARRRRLDPEYKARGLEANKRWREKNRDKLNAASKEWYAANAEEIKERRRLNNDAHRDRMLRSQYGLSLEEYNEMLAWQGWVCAICEHPETTIDSRRGTLRSLAVDHCHTTGVVRGLLCSACNITLGLVKDSTDVLENMVRYLIEAPVPEVGVRTS